MADRQEQAFDALQKRHAGHKLSQLKILEVFPEFHDGALYTVGFRDDTEAEADARSAKDEKEGDDEDEEDEDEDEDDEEDEEDYLYENYVYLAGEERIVFIDDEEVVRYISRTSHPKSTISRILQIVGIPGILALVIVIAIFFVVIQGKDPPPVLQQALASILGFYFAVGVYEPDGAHVYVANQAGTVSVIATATNKGVATIKAGGNAIGLAATPNGATVYMANNGDGPSP
jgi:YVTN family beta-propeller protein